MNDALNAIQWPAMAATLVAAWLVASQAKRKRSWGFICFIASNVLWVVWAWHDRAWALIALQFGLFALNLRGLGKNEPRGPDEGPG
jgi:TctA family transporter